MTPVDELAIPATVQAVLAARIDRLPEREKQVLQAAAVAAVVDKRFSESLLGRVVSTETPDREFLRKLQHEVSEEMPSTGFFVPEE